MPTYDYRCETNGRVVEVKHAMSETLHTWSDLCAKAGMVIGDTPASAPVVRLSTGGTVIGSASLSSGDPPACTTGSCCPSGFCGLN